MCEWQPPRMNTMVSKSITSHKRNTQMFPTKFLSALNLLFPWPRSKWQTQYLANTITAEAAMNLSLLRFNGSLHFFQWYLWVITRLVPGNSPVELIYTGDWKSRRRRIWKASFLEVAYSTFAPSWRKLTIKNWIAIGHTTQIIILLLTKSQVLWIEI